MEPDRRHRISDLYHAVLERQPAERTAFLQEACAGDEALRQEVESLLGYESASARFLETLEVVSGVVAAAPATTEMVGRQLGPYTILAPLGAGGMGEVYRARDSKLGREVALKVLPPHFTADPERRARFAREARSLATLNHPHIGAIYGLEDFDGVSALVLELVEGPTLADRLERGPLSVPDAVVIARQIADALEAAHEKGIVHRDLKPANIVLQGGAGASGPISGVRARVLDFGLAKTMAVGVEGDLTHRQSGSLDGTAEGRILGTPAYMSPEQARGQAVDKRTDIWAFGCVLFEMLSRRRPFGGDTMSDTFVSILEREPDWAALPDGTPVSIRALLERCLRKDHRKRLHDIADAFIDTDDRDPALHAPSGALARSPSERWQSAHDLKTQWQGTEILAPRAASDVNSSPPVAGRRIAWIWIPWAIAVFSVALSSALHIPSRPALTKAPGLRFDWTVPAHMMPAYNNLGVISPDGTRFVFEASVSSRQQLVVRDMATSEVVVLSGTDMAFGPFWAPDSRSVAFFHPDGHLKTVPVTGGPPRTIAAVKYDAVAISGTWRAGVILFGPQDGRIYRVPEQGGAATPVEAFAVEAGPRLFTTPRFLPDGRKVLLDVPDELGLYVGSLDTPGAHKIMEDGASALYAAEHLFYSRGTTLFARRFDPERLTFAGAEVQVANGAGSVSVSDNGTIVYRSTARLPSVLTWFDRDGRRTGTVGESGPYDQVVLSPRGRLATVVRLEEDGGSDLWNVDLATRIFSRLTLHPAADTDPSWAPDERSLAFTSYRGKVAGVFIKDLSSGKEDQLVPFDQDATVDEWTKDGRYIIFRTFGQAVYRMPLTGERKPELLQDTPYVEDEVHVSPNGRWVAFNSDESGHWEVYVAAFPTFTSKRQVSSGGGVQPQWSGDSRELFYIGVDGSMMSVRGSPSGEFQASAPRTLFPSRITPSPNVPKYAVTADGQRFLGLEVLGGRSFTFLINWLSSF